jgi:hypothetical protein
MIPTVGRIVHFIIAGVDKMAPDVHYAALIVGVHNSDEEHQTLANLRVFFDEAECISRYIPNVRQDTTGKIPGMWHEPERAP